MTPLNAHILTPKINRVLSAQADTRHLPGQSTEAVV